MIRRHLFARIAACSALALFASAAAAAPTSWDQPSGSQATFTYSSGQSENGLFGSPAANDNGFVFAPPGLVATAIGGGVTSLAPNVGHDEASDTVSVILNAKPNTHFTSIGARLLGDYAAPFGLAGVNTNATLRVYNLDAPAAAPITSPLVFDPVFPRISLEQPNTGEFTANTSIIPAGWRNIRVELSDFVSADALVGSATIQTKGANIDVETASIPVPAAVAVAPILGAIAWKARRRYAR